jgi:quinol monooxygenase YgiN
VLAIIATMKVKPGMEKEFEMEATNLVAIVNAAEPACKLYVLCRGAAPNTYVMLERYIDQAALDYHRSTSHYKEVGTKIGRYVEGKVDVQILTEVRPG